MYCQLDLILDLEDNSYNFLPFRSMFNNLNCISSKCYFLLEDPHNIQEDNFTNISYLNNMTLIYLNYKMYTNLQFNYRFNKDMSSSNITQLQSFQRIHNHTFQYNLYHLRKDITIGDCSLYNQFHLYIHRLNILNHKVGIKNITKTCQLDKLHNICLNTIFVQPKHCHNLYKYLDFLDHKFSMDSCNQILLTIHSKFNQ